VTVLMMLSREVRCVPMDYNPPQDERGHWCPVLDKHYEPALRKWQEGKRRWESGEDPKAVEYPQYSWEEWSGEAPDPDYYYPGEAWPADAVMGIRMYESVSEGTPISATYPDTAEGKIAMSEELATRETGITSDLTAHDWLDVIEQKIMAKDIHTGQLR